MKLPAIYNPLVTDIKKIAKKNGITITPSREKILYEKGETEGSAGYFSETNMELAYSTYGNYSDIVNLILHESCHMDQFLEDKFLWNKCNPGYDHFFRWLNSKEEICPERLNEYVNDIIRIEKDCEERSVQKIIKYNLPVNIEKYIQKANSYLYSFRINQEDRLFHQSLYGVDYVWSVAPKKFKNNYDVIPVKLRRAFTRRIKELKKQNV